MRKADFARELKIPMFDVPKKQAPDWSGLANHVMTNGPVLIDPSYDKNTAHACMHKHGVGCYAIKIAGVVIAYSIEPLRVKAPIRKATGGAN